MGKLEQGFICSSHYEIKDVASVPVLPDSESEYEVWSAVMVSAVELRSHELWTEPS